MPKVTKKKSSDLFSKVFWLGLAAVVGLGAWQWMSHHGASNDTVLVKLPASLSTKAAYGQQIFETNCVACHGKNAGGGTGNGPPLVHIIYEPNHHGDEAFYRAVKAGVRMHHWNFGDMPALEGIRPNQASYIISYIRELQRENGIN